MSEMPQKDEKRLKTFQRTSLDKYIVRDVNGNVLFSANTEKEYLEKRQKYNDEQAFLRLERQLHDTS